MRIPPYLSKGDTVGILCPSGFMPYEQAIPCINILQQWGFRVKEGSTLHSQYHYFSGTDDERLRDLQQMLDDDNIAAILCGRGGYGLSRIIDYIDFTKFKAKPKWIIGFSDITLLHTHIYKQCGIATLHAPTTRSFTATDALNKKSTQSLYNAIIGTPTHYIEPPHPLNTVGVASGVIVGGNLTLLAHSIGTNSAPFLKNKILLIEDVGEFIYNIDRLFIQLKRSNCLEQLAGMIIGTFSEIKDTTIPYGKDLYTILKEHTQSYNFPVCFNFPVGHTVRNLAIKCGVSHTLQISQNNSILFENR